MKLVLCFKELYMPNCENLGFHKLEFIGYNMASYDT